MSDKLNRRTILAGAAAVPALAIPAAGAASTFATASEPDPVFATVAAHREAFVEHMRAARLDGKFMRSDPGAEATGAALDAADEALDGATLELSEVVPTTMAGVVALLRHLEKFQEQAIELPEDARCWHSGDHDAIRLGTRGGIGATQQVFADLIGVPVKTLRNWEQRRREPAGPARVLLSMIERDPRLVFDVANVTPFA